MEPKFYFERLYPLQDRILGIFAAVQTDFHFTGGTAVSRGYFNHRFSDDLDLFVNDDDRFHLFAERLIQALGVAPGFGVTVLRRDGRFVRATVSSGGLTMKIELVNDVPAHVGTIVVHPVLGRLDSIENILANKISAAIDRDEPKDLADIWAICTKRALSLEEAITNAGSKAAGILAPDVARVLCSATQEDWESVAWIEPPPAAELLGSDATFLRARYSVTPLDFPIDGSSSIKNRFESTGWLRTI